MVRQGQKIILKDRIWLVHEGCCLYWTTAVMVKKNGSLSAGQDV